MLISKRPSALLHGWASIIFSMLLLCPMGELNVEAALIANEVLTTGDRMPEGNLTTESSLDLWKTQDWENRLLGEILFKPNPQQGLFQKQHNSLFHLKSPGKLPGIEFGVEMHSLQAIQSVVPAESLPKGFDPKQDQPLLLSPSINAPDYNGGFLRFTW